MGQELHYYSLIREREKGKYTMATSNGSIITEWSKCQLIRIWTFSNLVLHQFIASIPNSSFLLFFWQFSCWQDSTKHIHGCSFAPTSFYAKLQLMSSQLYNNPGKALVISVLRDQSYVGVKFNTYECLYKPNAPYEPLIFSI